jgi:hypothetical protein
MFKLGMRSKRSWRPLISVLVAYAVAAQTLLITLSGFALAAHVDTEAAAFAVCLHDVQSEPGLPAGTGHPSCSYCICCLAGLHHALIGSPPAVCQRLEIRVGDAPRAIDRRDLPGLSAHSIASPRGPPLGT